MTFSKSTLSLLRIIPESSCFFVGNGRFIDTFVLDEHDREQRFILMLKEVGALWLNNSSGCRLGLNTTDS